VHAEPGLVELRRDDHAVGLRVPVAHGVVSEPRLVATDLDGTLLRSDGTVSARTAGVLAALDARGVPVVLVTARPVHWVSELAPLVGGRGWAICSNGAVLLDLARDEVVLTRTMTAAEVRAAVDAIRAAEPGVTFAIVGLHGYAKEPGYVERTGMPPNSAVGPIETLIRDDAVLKLLTRHATMPPEAFRALVTAAVADGEVTASDLSGVVEISAPGVSKATTLALVCERFGVAADEVVAFGDMPNDLPMLAWAGRSFAVGEAHPLVVAAAADRAPSNDEDGVAQVLERLFGL
jgi:HAD superfamily hydrolase (TIGR01484 family)